MNTSSVVIDTLRSTPVYDTKQHLSYVRQKPFLKQLINFVTTSVVYLKMQGVWELEFMLVISRLRLEGTVRIRKMKNS